MRKVNSDTNSRTQAVDPRSGADVRTAIDRCFEAIDLDVSHAGFQRLPRNAAYKYEYFNGRALLTPRPKAQFVRLDLPVNLDARLHGEGGVQTPTVRAIEAADWRALRHTFMFAFERVPPFGTLPPDRRLEAAEAALQETRDGVHGEVIESASCVAVEGDSLTGACIITVPAIASRQPREMSGQPNLSWIFVSPMVWRHGAASALLAYATNQLEVLGHATLYSSMLVGNAPSTFWHWRRGFRLLEDPLSLRR